MYSVYVLLMCTLHIPFNFKVTQNLTGKQGQMEFDIKTIMDFGQNK